MTLLVISVVFYRLHIFSWYIYSCFQISFLISCIILTIDQIFRRAVIHFRVSLTCSGNGRMGFCIYWLLQVECLVGHFSSSTSLFFALLPKEIHGHRSNKTKSPWPFRAINSAKQDHQHVTVCHCSASHELHAAVLIFFYFLVVNVSSRECGRPSLSR